jgi:cytochrome c-type protein NapB
MRRKAFVAAMCLAVATIASWAMAEGISTLRQGTGIDVEAPAPRMGKIENRDLRRVRNYPEQPPTIPHTTRDYEVSLKGNKCLTCHSRTRIGESQAPMVSVTHFMDRDGQVLATISPRRYFCNQCHVTQIDVPPLIDNTFIDVEDLISGRAKKP